MNTERDALAELILPNLRETADATSYYGAFDVADRIIAAGWQSPVRTHSRVDTIAKRHMSGLTSFVRESNKIEGILRDPTEDEIAVHRAVLSKTDLTVADVEQFVAIIAPSHRLRRHVGLDVYVGDHVAPSGGPDILVELQEILADASTSRPYDIHQRYEYLHPFTDGNGRSGRAIWLWMMDQRGRLESALALGFLHTWYYDTLARYQKPNPNSSDRG